MWRTGWGDAACDCPTGRNEPAPRPHAEVEIDRRLVYSLRLQQSNQVRERKRMKSLFDIQDKVIVVTGGGGVLCGEMARALGQAGAKVAILDLFEAAAGKVSDRIQSDGGAAIAVKCGHELRMKYADPAHGLITPKDARRTAGLKCEVFCRQKTPGAGVSNQRQYRLNICLDIKEIGRGAGRSPLFGDGGPVSNAGQHGLLSHFLRAGKKAHSILEQPYPPLLAGQIVPGGLQKPCP